VVSFQGIKQNLDSEKTTEVQFLKAGISSISLLLKLGKGC
jgi:hypothetical protein